MTWRCMASVRRSDRSDGVLWCGRGGRVCPCCRRQGRGRLSARRTIWEAPQAHGEVLRDAGGRREGYSNWQASGRTLWLWVALLSGAAVASFGWTGHGIKDEGLPGMVHLLGDLLHLFTAAIWLGGLVPLAVLVRQSLQTKRPTDAVVSYHALERFSGIGVAAVGVLVFSGIINSWFLIGRQHASALLTTTYGLALSLKLILFGLTLALAANNRYRLTPRLAHGIERRRTVRAEALQAPRRSLLAKTGLAVLVLAAIAFLGTLEPPIPGDLSGSH
jgi:putative copper resistance protein D